jgi:RNA polymerase primary sigma factor
MILSSYQFYPNSISSAAGALPLGPRDEALREPFGRSSVDASRSAMEAQARRLLGAELRFVPHPSFDDPAAYPVILGPGPAVSEGADPHPDPLLTREEEAHLFRKMNFLKHRAARLRDAINPVEAAADLDLIEALQGEAQAVKNQIVRANLRLVLSMVKRVIRPGQDIAELLSDGFLALIRAVEKFDFSRGNKFSTYASWAILHNLSRDSSKNRRRDRLVTGHAAMLEFAHDYRHDTRPREAEQERLREAVRGLLGRLDDRERTIIVGRFGLEGAGEKTLAQLGAELGITKERVRQIEARARDKLLKLAQAEEFEPLAS